MIVGRDSQLTQIDLASQYNIGYNRHSPLEKQLQPIYGCWPSLSKDQATGTIVTSGQDEEEQELRKQHQWRLRCFSLHRESARSPWIPRICLLGLRIVEYSEKGKEVLKIKINRE